MRKRRRCEVGRLVKLDKAGNARTSHAADISGRRCVRFPKQKCRQTNYSQTCRQSCVLENLTRRDFSMISRELQRLSDLAAYRQALIPQPRYDVLARCYRSKPAPNSTLLHPSTNLVLTRDIKVHDRPLIQTCAYPPYESIMYSRIIELLLA